MTSDDALAALRRLDHRRAEAVVLSGTGMPTLQALRVARGELALPVISSNLCLAWSLLRAAAPAIAPSTPQWLLPS
jgi:maleate isomerase